MNTCPVCGSRALGVRNYLDSFEYGVDNPVRLNASVPLIECLDCGFEFTDERAEAIREAAVEKHLAGKKKQM